MLWKYHDTAENIKFLHEEMEENMRFNKTKLLSYGIVLSMTAVSMLSTSPIASAAGNVKDEGVFVRQGLGRRSMLYEMERKKEYIKGVLLSEKICRHVHDCKGKLL